MRIKNEDAAKAASDSSAVTGEPDVLKNEIVHVTNGNRIQFHRQPSPLEFVHSVYVRKSKKLHAIVQHRKKSKDFFAFLFGGLDSRAGVCYSY